MDLNFAALSKAYRFKLDGFTASKGDQTRILVVGNWSFELVMVWVVLGINWNDRIWYEYGNPLRWNWILPIYVYNRLE